MKSALLGLVLVLVSGCGIFGGNSPYEGVNIDTTRKAILVANAELRAANLLLQEVIKSRSISGDDARRALDGLQDVHKTLQAALNAVDLFGDPIEAQGHLDSAIVSLDLVLAILAPSIAPPQAISNIESLKEAA